MQSKDGTRFDFGLLPPGEGPPDALGASTRALERDPEVASGGVYRWLLTRMADEHGSTDATDSFHSLLERVQVEGRPLAGTSTALIAVGDATVRESSLSDRVVGQLLPPMTFRYTRMPSGMGAIPGFGTIDANVHTARFSPPHSVDEGRSDLFDVNSDGLPD